MEQMALANCTHHVLLFQHLSKITSITNSYNATNSDGMLLPILTLYATLASLEQHPRYYFKNKHQPSG